MENVELNQELTSISKGLKCTSVELYAPESWSFDFEGRLRLNVQCPWRIVSEHGIMLGSVDDGQMFGHATPVDGATATMRFLAATLLREVLVTEKTGDIVFEFESGIRLEIFNNSSGYEGWNCGTSSGLEVIGMGGGTTARIVPH